MRAASRLLTRVTPIARATAGGPSRPPPPRPSSTPSSSSSPSTSRPQVVTRLTPEQIAAAHRAQEAQWSAPPRGQAVEERPQEARMELPAGARMAPKQEGLGPKRDRSKGLVDSFRGLSPNMRIAIGVGIGMFAFFVMMVDEYVDTFNPATETDGAAAANAARQLGIRVVDSDRK